MASAQKVLVTGPAKSLKQWATKLTTMQTKHSFDLVLAMDLFSDLDNDSIELAELLAGKITIPVQVYVAVGGGALPEKVRAKVAAGEEVCSNLMVLGKCGLLTLASGLRVGTFGGSYDASLVAPGEDALEVQPLLRGNFTAGDINTFRSLLTPTPTPNSSLPPRPIPTPDILLTHSLPYSLSQLSAKPITTTAAAPAVLDEIAKLARAKYHFVGGAGVFWEREPFEWSKAEGGGYCRSISLGEMGNKAKERWFYAFSITPGAAAGVRPPNVTQSPFSAVAANGDGPRGMKRPAGSLDNSNDFNEFGVPNYIFGGGGGDRKKGRGNGGAGGPPPDHYTCNICEKKGHWIQECPEKAERDAQREAQRGPRGAPHRPIQPDECWFCLSNPKVTKHLIASIGDETYLTLPKGQLCRTTAEGPTPESPVPGGGHVLIIPIPHYPTLLSIPADLAPPIVDEVNAYKKALRECYASYGAKLVSFEVGRLSGKGGHAHVQIFPVPDALAESAESTFVDEGAKTGVTFLDSAVPSDVEQLKDVTENYFRVDLPDGRVLTHIIPQGAAFNLQFGRTIMAQILGTPDRSDWKVCSQTEAEEKNDTKRFKTAFKQYDPSE